MSVNETDYEPSPRVQLNSSKRRDILYFTKINRWILVVLGIWQLKLNGKNKIISISTVLFASLTISLTLLTSFLHLLLEEENVVIKIKLIGPWSFCFMGLIKYFALILRHSNINFCIKHVKEDWRKVKYSSERDIMFKHAKAGRNLTIISIIFMYGGGLVYFTILQYMFEISQKNSTMRPLIYPMYNKLLDARLSPAYELVYATNFLCGYMTCSVICGSCGLAALFVMHACGQAEVLMAKLDNLIAELPKMTNSSLQERFCFIIKFHLRILRFCTVIDKIFQEVCLVELVGSAFIICLLEYYCIMNWKYNKPTEVITYILLLISISFNLFILCYIGELLMQQVSQIGIKCFMSDWYRLPTEIARGLVLMIAISNNPAKLTALRIADMSLFTFGSILKTSLAYLSFLRTSLV